jgi:hypothetical protein
MWKYVSLPREADPLLDEVESWNLADTVTTQTKGKNLKPGKFFPGGSEMGDGKCNVLQYTGTDG